jgi:spermidine/putrescine transport system permease protein
LSTTSAAGTAISRPRIPALRLGFGRWVFVLPPLIVVLLVLVGPVILLSLYSVDLRTNIPGVPTDLSYDNWKDFLLEKANPFRARFVYSMEFTVVVSLVTTAAAYPLAYYLAFHARRLRYTLLLLLIVPFFTSYLLRIVAWSDVMLNENGVVNQVLWALHVQPQGVGVGWLLYSNFSIFLVLFYSWIPFVALPIFAVLENMDRSLIEAARDLGAGPLGAFARVTFPLSLPGVISAFVFVLIPTTGEFITPLYVGGPYNQLFGNEIQAFFGNSPNWNYGAVLAISLIAVVLVLMLVFGRFLNTDLRESSAVTAR